MADSGAATVCNLLYSFTNKMSLCQMVSMECLSPLFSSPVCSSSHNLANAMMSTKNACAMKVVKFQ